MIRDARLPYLVTGMMILTTAICLLAMGRVMICPCGHIDLWGAVGSAEANMQLADWYTPSHLLHGLLFYAGLWAVLPRLSVGWRLVLATALECAWELVENTDAVIGYYRANTVSGEYIGDSVVNSLSDIAVMLLGFGLARVLPVWACVLLVVGFEILTALVIRDGLALNILMFVWPLDAVLEWQQAG